MMMSRRTAPCPCIHSLLSLLLYSDRTMITGQVYVPLYRSEGDDIAPVVGEPWAPDKSDIYSSTTATADDDDPFSSPSHGELTDV